MPTRVLDFKIIHWIWAIDRAEKHDVTIQLPVRCSLEFIDKCLVFAIGKVEQQFLKLTETGFGHKIYDLSKLIPLLVRQANPQLPKRLPIGQHYITASKI